MNTIIVTKRYVREVKMSIPVQWRNAEHTILEFQFPVVWTWAEFEIADRQAREMLDAVQHKVDIILAFDPKGRLPENSFAHIRHFVANAHRNQGIIVIVGLNVFIRMVGSVMEAVSPRIAKERRIAANLDDALRIIAEVQRERSQSSS